MFSKADKNEVERILIISKRTFEYCSFEFRALKPYAFLN